MPKQNDLLAAVITKKPVEFKSIFESIIKEKVTAKVLAFKEELHKRVFNESASADGNTSGTQGARVLDPEDDVENTPAKDEGESGDLTQAKEPD